MAFLTMSMYSESLAMDTNMSVILPENRKMGVQKFDPERKYPILYCLHGHGDDHTAWIRKSNIELIAREYSVVVVMPTTQRGFYVDGHNNLKYSTYISQELPVKMANFFPVSTKREDSFIMGNSMGGYGVLRIVMANPHRYAGGAAFSCALPQKLDAQNNPEFARGMELAFGPGDVFERSDNNLLNLVYKLNEYKGIQPKLYSSCGRKDSISYHGFVELDNYIKSNGKNLDYQSWTEEDGVHNWDFWNPQIQKAFELFGFQKNNE